jgi:hypothetical protein
MELLWDFEGRSTRCRPPSLHQSPGGVLHRRTTASPSDETRDEPGDEQDASDDERPRGGLDEQADAAEDECQNEKNDEKSHVGSFE